MENTLQKLLKEAEALTSGGYGEIASHLPKDRPPVGFFCPYIPEELLHAAGAQPIRLMGAPIRMSHAQAHLPPYCCHLIKSSLESLLQGKLDFLKGVIFSQTCDSMQGLSDIWAHQQRLPLHFDVMVPSHFCSELARVYFKSEMERLKNFLEEHFGKITPPDLKASIELFNRIRTRLREIYGRRAKGSRSLPGSDFAVIVRAGYLMDRSRYNKLLEELLNRLPEEDEKSDSLVPVFLYGNITHSAAWFSLMEEAGARVVMDDLCSGGRFLRLMVPESSDPMGGLVDRYFSSFLCPTKHKGASTIRENLVEDVKKSGAKGVIFLLYKYCETHFFDYPDLKSALELEGIPTLLLEVEDPSSSMGQLKTRIQAFVEMLNPF
jgi:benzoyl-CoA reductase subunit C